MMFGGTVLSTLAAFGGIVWIWTRAMPALAGAVAPMDDRRHGVLDGFRGLLAVSVLLHHAIMLHHARLGVPLTSFDRFLGRGAVAFFFMTSAALFVGQALDRGGAVSPRRFLVGRVRRIVPLYLFAVASVAAAALWEAGGMKVSGWRFLADLVPWLLFDFVPRPDLNGSVGSADYLGMVWSLRYEWMLYAVLPILAYGYRITGRVAVLLVGLALASIPVHLFALFLAGAAAVPLSRIGGRHLDMLIAIAAAIGIAIAVPTFYDVASARAAPFLLPAFVLVLRGRSPLIAWMAARPMRYLGQISYSVYLLHGVVLALMARHADFVHSALTAGPVGFVAAMQIVFVAVLTLATITYLAIERPFATPGFWRGRMAATRRLLAPTAPIHGTLDRPAVPLVNG